MASKSKTTRKVKNVYYMAFLKTWKDFSCITSIHGLKYTADSSGNPFSKTIWICITLISFAIANTLVYTFYLDFLSNPTRLNIETDHAPLPEIMFPAVTICSSNYISYIKAMEFISELKLPPNVTNETVYSYFRQVTGFRMKTDYFEDDLNELQNIIDANRYSVTEVMLKLRAECKELLYRCRFQSKIYKCSQLFQVSKTYSGACCSFNLNQKGVRYLQERATSYGPASGLSVIVTPIIDDAAITATYSDGVKLFVHKNDVFPSETTIEKLIPISSEALIRIRPTVITCSNQVRQLGMAERNCLFPEERQLQFFSNYDDENCIVECQIQNIIDKCACVPYYFIQVDNKPVCNFTKIPCLVDNFDQTIVRKESPEYRCECLQSCQNIIFDVQTNAIPLIITNHTIDGFYNGISDNSTVIHVFFNSQVYKRLRRDLLTNFISLISNFGSAYSLFVGMSIVSVMEILFFFSYVLHNNINQMKQEDNRVALFTKRLNKHNFNPWKDDRNTSTPVLEILD